MNAERERKLYTELRRGIIILVRAMCEYYALSWWDIMPPTVRATVYSATGEEVTVTPVTFTVDK